MTCKRKYKKTCKWVEQKTKMSLFLRVRGREIGMEEFRAKKTQFREIFGVEQVLMADPDFLKIQIQEREIRRGE